MKLVLSLFDLTGNMVKPWAEAGYETLCVDTGHSLRSPKPGTLNVDLTTPGPLLVELRRRGIQLSQIAMLFGFPVCTDVSVGFPVCTDVSVSGARDFKIKRPRALALSIERFATCQELSELLDCPFMFENPVSTLSTYWRKPDHTFNPSDFTGFCAEDNYTKKKCLWTGKGFVMPAPSTDESLGPPDDRIHKAAPGDDRASFRSATPMGFARAVFEANTAAPSGLLV